MAINGMTTGRDYAFGYYDADSQQMIDLGDVQNVTITANWHEIKSMPYNDVPRFGDIPDGYTITGTVTRTGQSLEDFQLAANARFNAGLSTKAGYFNETVSNNLDGSTSRYQYTGFVFRVDDLGTVSRDATVKVTFRGKASDKKKIA